MYASDDGGRLGAIVGSRDERAQRAVRNELLFRAVNEQIVGMTEQFRAQLPDVDLVCECASASCTATIRIGMVEFSRVERAENAFLVRPGHEDDEIEDVVDRNGQFVVVRKRDPIGAPLG
jgi:hypothetical protein